MTPQQINETTNRIRLALARQQILEALQLVKTLVDAAAQWPLQQDYERVAATHGYLLQYLTQGIIDPERQQQLQHTASELYSITDRCLVTLNAQDSSQLFYARRRMPQRQSLEQLIAAHEQLHNKMALLGAVDEAQRDHAAILQFRKDSEALEAQIFNAVWTSFPTEPHDIQAAQTLLADERTPWHLQCLVLSALLLGLNKFYDEPKLLLLIDTYRTSPRPEVQLRALVAALVTLFTYRRRIAFSTVVREAVSQLAEVPTFGSDAARVFVRLVNSRNTGNIAQRMKQDLIPDINKMRPELLKKMKNTDTPVLDLSDIDANPDWQQWVKESGIERKLQELNEIQMEGGDVFISTFAHLKSFPFFNTLAHWFLPFVSDHSVLSATPQSAALTRIVNANPFMCDSDKYSMILSLSTMPQDRKDAITRQLEGAFEHEHAEEIAARERTRDAIINCYIQDLYRFFNLFSRRQEFYHVLDTSLNLLEVPFLGEIINDYDTVAAIAEFYLKNGFYDDAITFYETLLHNQDNDDSHIYQKIGFAHHNMGDYRKAIENYKRYELVDPDDTWNLRHIAACYKALKRNDKALAYYQRALLTSPDNITLCLNTGHCLLQQGNVEEALQLYFKVDFLDDTKHRAWSPIAWCSLLNGNYEQSERYFAKLETQGSPTASDHLNHGHLMLITGQLPQAFTHYARAIQALDGDERQFTKMLLADGDTLASRGVDRADLPLIADAAIYHFRNNS